MSTLDDVEERAPGVLRAAEVEELQTETEEKERAGEESQERMSRKREREASVEPGTPQATSSDIEHAEHRDRRAPKKKNRVSAHLDVAAEAEEEEDAEPTAPEASVSGSPPHESKIRQISQGVEDMTWKNMPKHPTPQPDERKDDLKENGDVDHAHDLMDTTHDGPEKPESAPPHARVIEPEAEKADTEKGAGTSAAPPPLHEANPPVVLDDAGADEYAGGADLAEVPPPDEKEGSPASVHLMPVEPPRAVVADRQEDDEKLLAPSTPPRRDAPIPMVISPLPVPSGRRDVTFKLVSRRGSDSSDSIDGEKDKGLKRKMGDRTVSETKMPPELAKNGIALHPTAAKRPRDDPDADENPRQTKRPTPPPDEDGEADESSQTPTQYATGTSPSTPASKIGGFASYASTSSPFASVKGPSLFSTKSSPWASTSTTPFPTSSSSPKMTSTPLIGASALFNSMNSRPPATPAPTPVKPEISLKRSGFEAFSSTSSPFATAAKRSKSPPPSVFGSRSKSPVPGSHHHPLRAASSNAFTAYASGGAYAFSRSAARQGSGSSTPALTDNGDAGANGETSTGPGSEEETQKDEGPSVPESEKESFSARLRAQKDDDEDVEGDKKMNLTEQELHTGEEDETTVYQVRGKLYALSDGNSWRERGTGQLKLNVRREDGTTTRLLMRKEAVYTVILNVSLFKGMKCFLAQDPRYLRFSVFEDGNATHYNLRVSNAKIAEELLEEINAHIPVE